MGRMSRAFSQFFDVDRANGHRNTLELGAYSRETTAMEIMAYIPLGFCKNVPMIPTHVAVRGNKGLDVVGNILLLSALIVKREDVRCQRHNVSSDDGLGWTSDAYCQRIDLEDVNQQVPAQARGLVRDPAIGSGYGFTIM
jgi:hypothetical protein